MARPRRPLRWLRPHPCALACAFAALAVAALAQADTVAARAAAAFARGSWAEAAPLFDELVRREPANAAVRLQQGVVLLHLGRPDQGLTAIDKAAELGAPAPQVEFRRACAHAVRGDSTAALDALDRALQAGFGVLVQLQKEPLLESVRSTPRFASFVTRIERALNPCKHDPKYREFDFWLGTWDVVPNGAPPGTPGGVNVVTLEHGDCIVHEHWTGNITGESFNLYDKSRGTWVQTWVDSSGGLHEYRGGLDANGSMAFTAELAAVPGQTANPNGRVSTRLTFSKLPGGQVRQLSEQSSDGGKSWQVSYDLIYTRRSE